MPDMLEEISLRYIYLSLFTSWLDIFVHIRSSTPDLVVFDVSGRLDEDGENAWWEFDASKHSVKTILYSRLVDYLTRKTDTMPVRTVDEGGDEAEWKRNSDESMSWGCYDEAT